MPDEPPVTAEEEASMDRLAEAWLHANLTIFTPLYVLAHGLLEPFTAEPARWPFRLGVMPEDDPT